MRTFSGRRSTLALAIADVIAMSGFMVAPEVCAEGFIDDSTLTGGIYYWQYERDRKDVTDSNKYKTNFSHSTWNANLDLQSGYVVDMFGLDIAMFTAIRMAENGDSSHLNEIVFSKSNKAYGGDWSGDKSGTSLYKIAVKFKYGSVWARAGHIQPAGQMLLAPHWSSVPGTYQGTEAGVNFGHGDTGTLSFSYMWINEYKAPWHLEMDEFYQNDKTTKIDYLHSLRAKCDFKNNPILEAVFGQAEGYIDRYFAKASYKFDIVGSLLTTSYQLYGIRNKVDDRSTNDPYDSTVWLQALTFGHRAADVVDLRSEGIWVKADGQQGYFLQRITPAYTSSNGRLDIWWDNRPDSNANGERVVFFGAMYDLKNQNLPGFAIGASCVCAWDTKPAIWQSNPDAYYDKNRAIEKSAYSLGVVYTIQDGRVKGMVSKLHFTEYDNHSDIPSRGGGYGNIFRNERDAKSMVIAPFTIFQCPTRQALCLLHT